MKKTLQIQAGLNAIKSQLNYPIWAMSGEHYMAFKEKIETLASQDFADGDTNEEDFPVNDVPETEGADTAVVNIHGEIVYDTGLPEAVTDMIDVCDLANTYSDLQELKASKDISTVILSIDSPGGTSAYLDETYQLLSEIAQEKNLIIYAHGYCASAAYQLACTGEAIYVTPSCVIGSVGVKNNRLDVSKALEQQGQVYHAIASSPKKNWMDPRFPMSKDEEAWLESKVAELNQDFQSKVLSNRDVDPALLDGSIFFGTEAVKNGFADATVNSFDELIESLADSNSNN